MPRATLVPRTCTSCGNVKLVRQTSIDLAVKPLLCRTCSQVQRSKVRGVFRLSPRDPLLGVRPPRNIGNRGI